MTIAISTPLWMTSQIVRAASAATNTGRMSSTAGEGAPPAVDGLLTVCSLAVGVVPTALFLSGV